jgi:hypothetical protein
MVKLKNTIIEAAISLRDKGEEFPKEMYDQYNALGKEINKR